MKEINLETWDRREHFHYFLRNDLPFYNTCFNIEITGLPDFAKSRSLSLMNCITFLTMKSLLQIENFLYRLENGKVYLYENLDLSMTYLRENEKLFGITTVEYNEDLGTFDRNVKEAIRKSDQYFDDSLLQNRSNFVYISTLPWISFTSIDHPMGLKKEDGIPRVTWGKFFESDGALLLPYNIQVNHIFVDGYHVGKFHNILQKEIKLLIEQG